MLHTARGSFHQMCSHFWRYSAGLKDSAHWIKLLGSKRYDTHLLATDSKLCYLCCSDAAATGNHIAFVPDIWHIKHHSVTKLWQQQVQCNYVPVLVPSIGESLGTSTSAPPPTLFFFYQTGSTRVRVMFMSMEILCMLNLFTVSFDLHKEKIWVQDQEYN